MPDERCPTCGSSVTVASSDEGTSYYAPEVERLRERMQRRMAEHGVPAGADVAQLLERCDRAEAALEGLRKGIEALLAEQPKRERDDQGIGYRVAVPWRRRLQALLDAREEA